jgi:protein PhnA
LCGLRAQVRILAARSNKPPRITDIPEYRFPLCAMENICPDGDNHVCADCGHEWPIAAGADAADGGVVVRDVNGNVLNSGDTVTVIKDLKVRVPRFR